MLLTYRYVHSTMVLGLVLAEVGLFSSSISMGQCVSWIFWVAELMSSSICVFAALPQLDYMESLMLSLSTVKCMDLGNAPLKEVLPNAFAIH